MNRIQTRYLVIIALMIGITGGHFMGKPRSRVSEAILSNVAITATKEAHTLVLIFTDGSTKEYAVDPQMKLSFMPPANRLATWPAK